MGKIKGHSLINGVSGSIGKDLYVRKSGRNTIVSSKGIVRRHASESQQAGRQHFAPVALHARGALMEPVRSRTNKIIDMRQGISAKSAVIIQNLFLPTLYRIEPSIHTILTPMAGNKFGNLRYRKFNALENTSTQFGNFIYLIQKRH